MKDRLAVCEYYISKGNCAKGKCAEQNGLCQHCGKYKPRVGSKNLSKN